MLTGVSQQILIYVNQFSACTTKSSLTFTFAFALASAYEFPVLKFVGTQESNALALPEGLKFLPQLPRFRLRNKVSANQNLNQTGWQITHTLSLSNPQPHLSPLPFSFGHPTKTYTWRMAIILLGTD